MVARLRIVFMGTPDFSVPALQAVIDSGHHVIAVYTQPPRPKGRGQQVQNSPVHQLAGRHGIAVRTPRSLKKDAQAQADFAALDADVAIVAAYGLILPQAVLDAPRHGCLNIHASLLPRWRGASPIQHAILAGDDASGLTIMQMEAGLDTGPMIEKGEIALDDKTTAQSLHDELSALGASILTGILHRLATGETLKATRQDDALATYAPLLSKEDGRIDWSKPAIEIDRQIRALNPWPGVWTNADGRRFKILQAEIVDASGESGCLLDRAGMVSCGEGALRLLRLQPENAKQMDARAAFNGGILKDGDRFV